MPSYQPKGSRPDTHLQYKLLDWLIIIQNYSVRAFCRHFAIIAKIYFHSAVCQNFATSPPDILTNSTADSRPFLQTTSAGPKTQPVDVYCEIHLCKFCLCNLPSPFIIFALKPHAAKAVAVAQHSPPKILETTSHQKALKFCIFRSSRKKRGSIERKLNSLNVSMFFCGVRTDTLVDTETIYTRGDRGKRKFIASISNIAAFNSPSNVPMTSNKLPINVLPYLPGRFVESESPPKLFRRDCALVGHLHHFAERY